MTKPSQTESGKAFEYCLAEALAQLFAIPLIDNSSKYIAQKAFLIHSEKDQEKMRKAAEKAALFLSNHDANLEKGEKVTLQIDKQGAGGDVRDIRKLV